MWGFFLLAPNVEEENGRSAKPQMVLEPKSMLNVMFGLARAVRAQRGAFCSLLFLFCFTCLPCWAFGAGAGVSE